MSALDHTTPGSGRLREKGHTVDLAMVNAIEVLDQRHAYSAADTLRLARADVQELVEAASGFHEAWKKAYQYRRTSTNSSGYVALLESRDVAETRLLCALANMQES